MTSLLDNIWDLKSPILGYYHHPSLKPLFTTCIKRAGISTKISVETEFNYCIKIRNGINTREDLENIQQYCKDLLLLWDTQKDFYEVDGDNRLYIYGGISSSNRQSRFYHLGIKSIIEFRGNNPPTMLYLKAVNSSKEMIPFSDTYF